MVDDLDKVYSGAERREFLRLDYMVPLNYKVCKKDTISKLLQGYTVNISEAGLLCKINKEVHKEDVLWLVFDRQILDICTELEEKALIYQNGIIGKVVRIEYKDNSDYSVGIKFLTREEKNLTNIYPKVHFLNKHLKDR